jgi:hypothetical protein
MKTLLTTTVCVLVVALATGCATDRTTGNPPELESPAGASAQGSAQLAPAPAWGRNQFTKPIGETVTYDSGSTVTVSNIAPFRPSGTAAGAEMGARCVSVDVVIKNGNEEPFDTSMTYVSATFNGMAAPQVFDSAKNISSLPSTQLQPGKEARATLVFALPQKGSGDLQVEVRPNFNSETAVFTGTS